MSEKKNPLQNKSCHRNISIYLAIYLVFFSLENVDVWVKSNERIESIHNDWHIPFPEIIHSESNVEDERSQPFQ